jgi:membrane protease YdiL (CAAX protease family)
MCGLHSNPHLLSLTLVIISAVTALVLLERTLTPTLRKWGDLYPAVLTFLIILSKTVIPLVLLWSVLKLSPASLGWVTGSFFQAVWKGVVLAALMMAVIFIYQHYSYRLFGTPYASTGAHLLNRELSTAAIGISSAAALLNACGEEIIFRGMLFPALVSSCGIILALVVQSFIFTVYHFFPLQNTVLLFFMGIFFGLGYLWSGSLLTPVLAHLTVNGLPVLVFLVRSVRT